MRLVNDALLHKLVVIVTICCARFVTVVVYLIIFCLGLAENSQQITSLNQRRLIDNENNEFQSIDLETIQFTTRVVQQHLLAKFQNFLLFQS